MSVSKRVEISRIFVKNLISSSLSVWKNLYQPTVKKLAPSEIERPDIPNCREDAPES
jgi:hypothetical protein